MLSWLITVIVALVIFFIGFTFALFIHSYLYNKGTMHIDLDAPEEDKYYLELQADSWEEIAKNRYITLKIEKE